MESLASQTAGIKAKVMIISDDHETSRVWAFCANLAGADVTSLDFSENVMQVWADETPDVIVVESIYRKNDELDLCQRLHQETPAPIILLTSGDDEIQIYQAYKAGVDECLPPPVSPRLFLMKIRSWLRRTQVVPSAALDEVQLGPFRLDPSRRLLFFHGKSSLKLTNLEARLLYTLMSHQGRILDTDYLVERVWGHYGNGDSALLKNLVYRLRRKIEPDPSQPCYLLTEANLGYRFMV